MKRKLFYRLLAAAVIVMAAVSTAFFWLTADFPADREVSAVRGMDAGWYYLDEAGRKIDVALPCAVENAGETLELCYSGGEAITPGSVVATKAARYDWQLYLGDTLLYCINDNGREINNAVRGNIVCAALIPAADEPRALRAVYHSANGSYQLPAVTISTENALLLSELKDHAVGLLLSAAMIVAGVFGVVLGCVLLAHRQRDQRILWVSLFLLCCGLWCLSDSPFIFMLTGYSTAIFDLDFYLFMVMPIPLFRFVLNSADMKKHGYLRALGLLYYVNIAAQSLLAAAGVFTFFRMLYVTHVLMMAVGFIIPLCILVRAYRRRKEPGLYLCIQSLAAIGVVGAIAIVLYMRFDYAAYQIVFQLGLLLLMSILLKRLLQQFVESVKLRAEAMVYKQLSEQDKLTKLENRRAYDALLEQMENGLLAYTNAVLLFVDVNYLKETNDSFGHDAGDQLLISVAECISKAFARSGHCYRIGGDEFCVVMLDPSNTAQELLSRIRDEQIKINSRPSTRHMLSLACGCSFINEGGVRKTISQWKTDADERMYENKRIIKEKTEFSSLTKTETLQGGA